MLERTAVSYLVIYLANPMVIENNGIIELGWLEREFHLADKTKFDGILLKTGNKEIIPALVEFVGDLNDKTPAKRNLRDEEKLHVNMIKVMSDTKTDPVFCMRCYGHYIYFERLLKYDGTMYRIVDATFEIPVTPRKLKTYITEIPKIFTWKQAVINHVLNFN